MAKQAPYNKIAPLGELVNSRPELAVESLKALAREYPSDPQVLYALGVALLNTGEFDEAITQLEAAAKRQKDDATPIYSALAQTYSYAGMPAHAYRAANKAGMNPPPWQETFKKDVPPNAKLADLITFEEARRHLLYPGPQSVAALRDLQAFIKKFPTYLPAKNVVSTGLFMQGKFAEARTQIETVLQSDPRNVHALLNLARVERLLGGVQAVRALQSRVEAARVQDDEEGFVMGGEIALANLYLLMDDAQAAEVALKRHLAEFDEDDEEAESPEVQQIQAHLDRVPKAPLMLPSELLPPGWFARWRKAGSSAFKTIATDLRSIPGWYEKLEEGILFEGELLASLFTTLLVNSEFDKAPLPDGVGVQGRVERFAALLQDGRGSLDGVLSVAQSLQSLDLLPKDAQVRDPDGNEIQYLSLELTDEPLQQIEHPEDIRQYEQALQDMRDKNFTRAIATLDAQIQKYPDHVSLRFNRATAIARLGGAENETQAIQEMETLWRTHPEYLFPPAQLAFFAIKKGDLARAREYLVFPKDLKRLHVQEYGFFSAVQAVLALHEGNPEAVKRVMPMLKDLLDEDDLPLRVLEQEILLYLQKHPGDVEAGALLELLE